MSLLNGSFVYSKFLANITSSIYYISTFLSTAYGNFCGFFIARIVRNFDYENFTEMNILWTLCFKYFENDNSQNFFFMFLDSFYKYSIKYS